MRPDLLDRARFLCPALVSAAAFFRVAAEVLLFFGAGTRFPARRALERPMAIACSGLLRLPSLAACISFRTSLLAPSDVDFFRDADVFRFDAADFFCAIRPHVGWGSG